MSWAYRVYLILIRPFTGKLSSPLSLAPKNSKLAKNIRQTRKRCGSFKQYFTFRRHLFAYQLFIPVILQRYTFVFTNNVSANDLVVKSISWHMCQAIYLC